MHSSSEITDFWRNAGPRKWFAHDPAFDAEIRTRFEDAHHAAARGDLTDWGVTADGALALLILLDQFPRNMYRGSAHAFATDALARQVATHAVAAGLDKALEPSLRMFFYLPFEHSEAPADQARSMALFEALAREAPEADNVKWARIHADIIERFGRFPHRNACLGRETTREEARFLAEGGFSG